MEVKLIAKTCGVGDFEGRTIDDIIVAQARVSTEKKGKKLFDNPGKLLRHLITEGHWSPFDLANLNIKIVTSRAMAREWLRHSSIKPQEFSQRYSEVVTSEGLELRIQAEDNRQSSKGLVEDPTLIHLANSAIENSFNSYETLINEKVARESARFILPEIASTTLYLNGTIRNFITALNVRLHASTAQKEIRLQAELIRDILLKEVPITCEALFNFQYADEIHILEQVVLAKHGFRNQALINHFTRNGKPIPSELQSF